MINFNLKRISKTRMLTILHAGIIHNCGISVCSILIKKLLKLALMHIRIFKSEYLNNQEYHKRNLIN